MQELNHRLIEKPEDVAAACEELSRRGEVGFDTETTSLSPFEGRVRLVQFASAESVYVFDLDRLAPDGVAARAESLEPLRRLLAATRPVKVAHNSKFDAKWVAHFLGVELCGDYDSRADNKNEVERGGLFDTLLASRSEEHTSELQSLAYLVCRLLL